MISLISDRILPLIFLAISLLVLWQAIQLGTWGFMGPGPGLFPAIIGSTCVVLSGILLFFPKQGGAEEADEEPPEAPMTRNERRTFATYVVSLLLIVVTTAYLGFLGTAVGLALLITYFGEGRSFRSALAFGICCTLIGVIAFGHYLAVDIPSMSIEQDFQRLLR